MSKIDSMRLGGEGFETSSGHFESLANSAPCAVFASDSACMQQQRSSVRLGPDRSKLTRFWRPGGDGFGTLPLRGAK